jgi:hypothetical protein
VGRSLASTLNRGARKLGYFLILSGCCGLMARAQTAFWATSGAPQTVEVTNDSAAVTLGLKFYSDVAGYVNGVRFYKGPHNTGTHVGTLWTEGGAKLASVTFSGETASGWQQANFSAPVSVAAKTNYVISYLAPKGYYADDQSYNWPAINATPLHVAGSSPGVYAYGSTTTFPSGTWNLSNYWVDLVFTPANSSSPVGTYSITGTVSGAAATLTLSGVSGASTTTGTGGIYSFSGLVNGTYLVAPSQSGYMFTPATASMTISGSSVTGVNFTATVAPAPVQHNVSLSWMASATPNISRYNVYRGTTSGGPYLLVSGSLVTGTAYVDINVPSGQTYYYVTTAIDSNNNESGYSNEAVAVVPMP